jgi:hypothetical protein
MKNHIYVTYQAFTWTPGPLSGKIVTTLNYPSFGYYPGAVWRFYRFGNRNDGTGSNLTLPDTVWIGSALSSAYGDYGPQYRWYDYNIFSTVGYEHTNTSSLDTWKIDKCFNGQCYWSEIELDYYNNGRWNTVSHAITNNSFIVDLPHNYNTRLIMKNPVTGRTQELYWIFQTGGNIDIQVSKGGQPNYPAAIGENVEATATYFGDSSQLGTVQWLWSKNGPYGNANSDVYMKNVSNNTWEKYPSSSTTRGAYNFDTQVMTKTDYFSYDDYDQNWSIGSSKKNFVGLNLWDVNGVLIEPNGYRRVYVGAANQPTLQFDLVTLNMAHVNNANLWVKDLTDNAYMYTGELLASGRIINRSIINHSYLAWATHNNYTFAVGCINSVAQNYCTDYPGQPANANTINFTTAYYGFEYITINMAPKEAGLLNASETLKIIDGDTNAALQAAQISIDLEVSKYTYWTDANGEIKLSRLITGKSYPYTADCRGTCAAGSTYSPATGNFSAVNGGYLTIKLYKTTSVTTPTPLTTLQPGQEGYVPSTWADALKSLFMMAGAGDLTMAGMLIGLLITGGLAFIFGRAFGTGGALVGSMIGFIGSSAVGFIPIWVLLVVIFMGALFFVSKFLLPGGSGA